MAYGWQHSRLPVPCMPFYANPGTFAFVPVALDGSGDKACNGIFKLETDDAITQVGCRIGTVTGTPPTYTIGLQSVTSGLPSGTYLGGGSPASTTFTPVGGDANTWKWFTLDNAYTGAVGDVVSLVIEYSSGTIDGSNTIQLIRGHAGYAAGGAINFPYSAQNLGSWAKSNGYLFGYRTASARYGLFFQNLAMGTSVTTSGHRGALAFTASPEGGSAYVLHGMDILMDMPASGTVTFGLWNAGGLVASTTLDSDQVSANTADRHIFIPFDCPTLTPGTKYYLGAQADGNAFEIAETTFAAADDIEAWIGQGNSGIALATFDGSSWTETATTVPLIQPIVESVTGRGVPLRQIIGAA